MQFNKLDASTLEACFDFYKNWLHTGWIKKKGKPIKTEVDICMESAKFKEYIGKKKSYLKKSHKRIEIRIPGLNQTVLQQNVRNKINQVKVLFQTRNLIKIVKIANNVILKVQHK